MSVRHHLRRTFRVPNFGCRVSALHSSPELSVGGVDAMDDELSKMSQQHAIVKPNMLHDGLVVKAHLLLPMVTAHRGRSRVYLISI